MPALIEEYTNNIDRGVVTRRVYKSALHQWLNFISEHNATGNDIQSCLAYKKTLIEKNLTPYTVGLYLTSVKSFFDYLVLTERLLTNPAKSIRGVRRTKSTRGSLTRDEALRLINLPAEETLEALRNHALLMLKLFTGLRDISVTLANVNDIKVRNDRYVLYYQGKGSQVKDDFVILDSRAYKAINDYLVNRCKPSPNEPLFTSISDRNRNQRLTTQTIRQVIIRLFGKAGIVRHEITPHSLRHTAVTFAILGGADMAKVRGMAGHRSINTTAEYFHDLERFSDPAELFISKYLFKHN